jgi:hypothetical protein
MRNLVGGLFMFPPVTEDVTRNYLDSMTERMRLKRPPCGILKVVSPGFLRLRGCDQKLPR